MAIGISPAIPFRIGACIAYLYFYFDDGEVFMRMGIGNEYQVDMKLTELGWDGIEDTDWIEIYGDSL